MRKVLCVEPVIFIYMFASSLTSPLVQQFIYRRLWEEEYNSTFVSDSNASACEQNKSSPAYIKQKEVQEKASIFNMQLDLTGAVPSLIVAFVIVANGDRQGRKRSLVLPSTGALIADICLTVIAYFSLSLSILFAVAFVTGLFGSMATFLGGGFAFIADVCHDEKQKTTRIAVVDLIFGVVSGLAGLSSGYFLRGIGFTWTFGAGEIDTRFSFCAVATLALLGKLDAIDVGKAVEFVLSCMNFDGGFGCRPGSESHAGQIYCCTGFLAITDQLHQINVDLLGWWLCERQLPSGGLNGRPEKLPDVCYSWWVLASLKMIGRLHWIDREKLRCFILACQDEETGGFADRPGDMVDPFHTLFGIAGLSLLGEEQIKAVNPVFCMPEDVLRRINVQPELVS